MPSTSHFASPRLLAFLCSCPRVSNTYPCTMAPRPTEARRKEKSSSKPVLHCSCSLPFSHSSDPPGAHLAAGRMYSQLRRRYSWPAARPDIETSGGRGVSRGPVGSRQTIRTTLWKANYRSHVWPGGNPGGSGRQRDAQTSNPGDSNSDDLRGVYQSNAEEHQCRGDSNLQRYTAGCAERRCRMLCC